MLFGRTSWQKNTATLDVEMLKKPTIFTVFFSGRAALHLSQLKRSTHFPGLMWHVKAFLK